MDPRITKIQPAHVGQKGLDLIRHFEGFQPMIYKCPAGKPTIGYGHVVKEGESFKDMITPQAGYEILQKDVLEAEHIIHETVVVPLTSYQFDALVSFIYNIGSTAWKESTFLKRLNSGEDYYDVSSEFLRWIYSGSKRLKGLMRRREAERQLFINAITG